jgi:hypothetical protein
MTRDCAAPQAADEVSTPLSRRHDAVLWLSTQTGDDIMSLQGSGDEIVAQEHHVARSGPASVGTTDPISISVDDEV